MRSLRKRNHRIDRLRSEARPKKRGTIGRYVYLATLLGFFMFLFDISAGELMYLRGVGMITRDVSVVSAEYPGTVLEVFVKEGQSISRGDPVALVRSQEILNNIAELANELATVQAKLSEMKIRRAKLDSLIPSARHRATEFEKYRDELQHRREDGLTTTSRQESVMNDAFDASEKLAQLEAEQEIVETELAQTQKAVDRARGALAELEQLYNNGMVLASDTGVVGPISTAPGEGFNAGGNMAEIFHGPTYVLAYVPVGKIYDIEANQEVVLRFGFHTVDGAVDRIIPLAPRLPKEFQQAFKTVERQQLVRIGLAQNEIPPPLFTEVEITSQASLRVLFAKAMKTTSEIIDDAGLSREQAFARLPAELETTDSPQH